MKIFLVLALGFCLSYALDVDVYKHLIPNGQTALLEFKNSDDISYKDVKVGDKNFDIVQNPKDSSKSYALIPFSYYEKQENKQLYIHYTQNSKHKEEMILLKVIDGAYKKESIQVSSSKVNPKSKAVKDRISKEYKEAMRIYNTVTPHNYITKPFIYPLKSKITSSFGKARMYNGSLKGYHSGTDFRAKVGTPIVASNDGKVVLVKDRFYAGGTVVIDHGEGVYTCYFHMSKFDVKDGDVVRRGERIGLSGESGRVTGPHLHFCARIKGVQVDPLQLITLLNNNILKGKKQ